MESDKFRLKILILASQPLSGCWSKLLGYIMVFECNFVILSKLLVIRKVYKDY